MDSGQLDEAVARLRAAVDALLAADLTAVDSATVLEMLKDVEIERRRLDAVDLRLICDTESRWVAGEYGQASTTDVLIQALHVSPRAARTRVQRARELGPRRTLSGEPLPPLFPDATGALAAGALSSEHADVIRTQLAELDHLPDLDPADLEVAEKLLVEAAQHDGPRIVALLGRQLRDRLDPDGREPREAELERKRSLTLTDTGEGWARITGTLSPELKAGLQAILDTLSAPQPAADGMPDDRTPPQRRHDALAEMVHRLLNSSDLPDAGGTPVTVLVRVDQADFLAAAQHGHLQPDPPTGPVGPTGRGNAKSSAGGYAVTGYGDLLPLRRLMLEACEAEMATIVTNNTGAVLALGRTRRCASRKQRLALALRDGGCCFPGCTRPAAWCEAHHVIPWQLGGRTDLANLCLLCKFHHAQFDKRGWAVVMTGGIPEWIPPPWLDPAQQPRRNTAHHLPDFDFVR